MHQGVESGADPIRNSSLPIQQPVGTYEATDTCIIMQIIPTEVVPLDLVSNEGAHILSESYI